MIALVTTTDETATQIAGLALATSDISRGVEDVRINQEEANRRIAEGLDAAKRLHAVVVESATEQRRLALDGMETLGRVLTTTGDIKDTSEKSLDGLTRLAESQSRIAASIGELATQTDLASGQQRELLERQRLLAEEQVKMRQTSSAIIAAMEQMMSFQQTMVGGAHGVLWYLGAAVIGFIVTTPARTAGARTRLMLGLIASFALELIYLIPGASPTGVTWFRALVVSAAIGWIGWSAWNYADFQDATIKALKDLTSQMAAIHHLLLTRHEMAIPARLAATK